MWPTIKNLLQKGGGKCIIVENEKPAYIVMKVEDYEKLLAGGPEVAEPELEEVNRDIAEWQAKKKEEAEITNNSQEVKVEDLPF